MKLVIKDLHESETLDTKARKAIRGGYADCCRPPMDRVRVMAILTDPIPTYPMPIEKQPSEGPWPCGYYGGPLDPAPTPLPLYSPIAQ